ncbi:hypothetical protein EJ110_NYTH55020, partial [Nymphaea thermarum]
GTGALAIFLAKLLQVDITTSDFDDADIEENIAHNCRANGLPVLPHIRPSKLFLSCSIVTFAADVKQYPNLVKTLSFLLKSYKPKDEKSSGNAQLQVRNTKVDQVYESNVLHVAGTEVQLPKPSFLMSWKRRIGREDESLFFSCCEACGLRVEHLGSRIYCINLTC